MDSQILELIEVRKPELFDLSDITSVHRESWRFAYKNILTQEELHKFTHDFFRQKWEYRLKNERDNVVLAQLDGSVVGVSFFSIQSPMILEIKIFYVHPDYHRMSIGTNLFEHILRVFDKQGCKKIVLFLVRGNESAYAFYRKLGFLSSGISKVWEVEGCELLADQMCYLI